MAEQEPTITYSKEFTKENTKDNTKETSKEITTRETHSNDGNQVQSADPLADSGKNARGTDACTRNKQLIQISFEEAGRENRTIEDEPYYHGFINKEEVMTNLKKDGQFLVRKTEFGGRPQFVLSVRKDNTVYHLLIRRTTTKRLYWVFNYAFKSIPDLIQYHYRNHSPVDEDSVYLKKPVFKEEWQLNHEQIELVKVLGAGAFGEVHKGTLLKSPLRPSIDVAVKTLHSGELSLEEKSRFLREANLMLSLAHPNIVQLFGVAAAKEPIMVVMELADTSLLARLEESVKFPDKALSVITLANFVYGAAKGMNYLHSVNIIHRDVAARNVLLKDGEAKISDFGLSCIGNEFREKKMKKVPIKWMAPETLRRGRYSRKSDVYSFGVLIWEVYSYGNTPFGAETENRIIRAKIIQGKAELIPMMEPPEAIQSTLKQCLLLREDERPSFADIIKNIETIDGIIIKRPSICEKMSRATEILYDKLTTTKKK